MSLSPLPLPDSLFLHTSMLGNAIKIPTPRQHFPGDARFAPFPIALVASALS